VWFAGAIYIALTYTEAVRHVPSRSARDTAVSVFREFWCLAWTQPLLPLFQFAGRRLGDFTPADGVPIVLVHGYFQNRVDFLYLARRLRAAGSGPLYGHNFFWPQPFEASSVSLRDFVERVRERTGAERVDLVTHSSGGLLALDLLRDRPEWVRRIAVIAVPWRGVTWPGPVFGPSGSQLRAGSTYTRNRPAQIEGGPVLSIYSAHDNLVHPPETSQISGSNVSLLEVRNLGHLAILFDREVADAVCEFLLPTARHASAPARSSAAEKLADSAAGCSSDRDHVRDE
jgi:pimeloyl-ACP methyl ester carboxylesterase